jgi:hypothetical protein
VYDLHYDTPYVYKYPKAGANNSAVALLVHAVGGDTVRAGVVTWGKEQ